MKMKQMHLAATTLVGALTLATAHAATTVLTFEGLKDQESVLNYYNGGLGGGGSGPGFNAGVVSSSNALAIIDGDAPGGTGNFGHEPSPSTVLYFLTGPAATLNREAWWDWVACWLPG
jgi:hypothetical protein